MTGGRPRRAAVGGGVPGVCAVAVLLTVRPAVSLVVARSFFCFFLVVPCLLLAPKAGPVCVARCG